MREEEEKKEGEPRKRAAKKVLAEDPVVGQWSIGAGRGVGWRWGNGTAHRRGGEGG